MKKILRAPVENMNTISESLLLAVKLKQPTKELCTKLANLPSSQIQNDLHNDDLKKAFWINIYNSFYLILRKNNNVQKPKIFT